MQRLSGKLVALNRFLSKVAERALPCLDTLKKCTNKKDFHWTTEAEEAFQAMKKLLAELPTLTAPKKEEELMVYLSAANEVEATGRLAKWGVELQAYGIKYAPRSTIKGQVLADFLANTMTEDIPTQLYTDGASNKHRSGAGLILIDPEGAKYSYALRLNFTNANNDAEYEALLAGLRITTRMKVKKLHAFVDSKLVANHVEGSYEAKGEMTTKYK
ncbi:reverse transcriptase domain-containing protein, partial [Tanacetum coccineum]